mmetsp:Transcript_70010/g.138822  ORF Transcript_70010/g.138822 Transcript_70010/m.138822 type:complete len:280 (-) Transcript_70010:345-1184(-)
MSIAPLSKYNFYHNNGSGRDGFIRAVSDGQTYFNYVPKAPEFPGTRMPGMASNMVGLTTKSDYTEKPLAVSGYTGFQIPKGGHEPPTDRNAFPNLPGAPTVSRVALETKAMQVHKSHIAHPNYRVPGFAGHCPGHQQVCGFTHGAVCWGDAGPTTLAAIGMDAPGLNAGEQLIHSPNLQPGTPIPAGLSRTKTGYTGHLPGRHYSTNFGKSFEATSTELLATDGKPDAGGISDPGQPFNSDTECKILYPQGHVGRPNRLTQTISGYAGFRPRTTPNAWR